MRIGEGVDFYKVGIELYAVCGMEIVRELMDRGKQVFLDLKFYDIPETVRRAVSQVARTGVRFLTVHAVGSVMRAAVEGKGDSKLQLLAVTVLTSFSPEDAKELGFTGPISDLVERRRAPSRGIGCRWPRGFPSRSCRRAPHHRPLPHSGNPRSPFRRPR